MLACQQPVAQGYEEKAPEAPEKPVRNENTVLLYACFGLVCLLFLFYSIAVIYIKSFKTHLKQSWCNTDKHMKETVI